MSESAAATAGCALCAAVRLGPPMAARPLRTHRSAPQLSLTCCPSSLPLRSSPHRLPAPLPTAARLILSAAAQRLLSTVRVAAIPHRPTTFPLFASRLLAASRSRTCHCPSLCLFPPPPLLLSPCSPRPPSDELRCSLQGLLSLQLLPRGVQRCSARRSHRPHGRCCRTVITLAISASSPRPSLSWAKYTFSCSPTTYVTDVGLLQQYININSNGLTYTMTTGVDSSDGSGVWPVAVSDCPAAGKGVIAAATFAMLFGLLAIFILHFHTTLNNWGRCCKLPFPRILLLLASFMSLTLYIVAVATYYSKCINNLQNVYYICDGSSTTYRVNDVNPGYAIATAIVCIVLSFFGWFFSFWRTCRPNLNEPSKQQTTREGQPQPQFSSGSDLAALPSSPAAAAAVSAAANGYGNAYGGGQAYGNDEDAAGSSPGGYGGSYGGAYGGSGYGGSAQKQQSAYGY